MSRRLIFASTLGAFAVLSAVAVSCSVNSEGTASPDQDSGTPDTGHADSSIPDSSTIDSGTDTGADTSADTKPDISPDSSADSGDSSDSSDAADSTVEADVFVEPKCDTTKSPKEDPCVIDESLGVFVSVTGDDANPGTRKLPYKTLAKAIGEGATAKKRVYACGEDFAEALQIPSNVSVFGGLKCSSNWSWDGTKRTIVKAPAGTIVALTIGSGTSNVTVTDFEFYAPDATAPGGSSIGAWIESSTSIRLERVKLVAGKGEKGTPPEAKPVPAGGGVNGKNGSNAVCGASAPGALLGGESVLSGCGTIDSQSGMGGTAAKNADGSKGGDGEPKPATPVAPKDGLGGSPGIKGGVDCNDGHTGADGTAGSNAAPPVDKATVTTAGYQPVNGNAGVAGTPGQGGGGGGASAGAASCVGASGGSGGSGGCGGLAGSGGKGGGASIGIVVLESKGGISLVDCDIEAKDAGDGGAGQDAGNGGAGANRGQRGTSPDPSVKNACSGGDGGNGGKGGAGSGGLGGASVSVWWTGNTSPVGNGTTMKKGNAGKGGAGGDGLPAIAGPDGTAAETYQQP